MFGWLEVRTILQIISDFFQHHHFKLWAPTCQSLTKNSTIIHNHSESTLTKSIIVDMWMMKKYTSPFLFEPVSNWSIQRGGDSDITDPPSIFLIQPLSSAPQSQRVFRLVSFWSNWLWHVWLIGVFWLWPANSIDGPPRIAPFSYSAVPNNQICGLCVFGAERGGGQSMVAQGARRVGGLGHSLPWVSFYFVSTSGWCSWCTKSLVMIAPKTCLSLLKPPSTPSKMTGS